MELVMLQGAPTSTLYAHVIRRQNAIKNSATRVGMGCHPKNNRYIRRPGKNVSAPAMIRPPKYTPIIAARSGAQAEGS